MNINRYVGQGIGIAGYPGDFVLSEAGVEGDEFNVILIFQHDRHLVLSADYMSYDSGLCETAIFAPTSTDEIAALSLTHLWQRDN